MPNFDTLPKKNPNNIEAGIYQFVVKTAEMRSPKDTSRPDYINVKLDLFDKCGNSVGSIYDGQFDSDNAAMQYKLSRFVHAIGLDLQGNVTLEQISKLLVGRTGAVSVTMQKDQRDGSQKPAVDVFGSDIYWTKVEYEAMQIEQPTDTGSEELPFDFAEGEFQVATPVAAAVGATEY